MIDLNQSKTAPQKDFTPFVKQLILSCLLGPFKYSPEILIWYLFTTSINFSPYAPKLSIYLRVSLPFLSTIGVHMLKYLSAYKNHSKISQRFKTYPVGVFIDDEFIRVEADIIAEGDFILLKQNDLVPCDCLVLGVDSEVENLYVKQMDCDDPNRIIRKKPLKETNRLITLDGMSIKELKRKIESVNVNYQSLCNGGLSGKIKMRESPAIILANENNFLYAGSFINDCEWVLGYVIRTGEDCKNWYEYSFSHSKFKPSFERPLRLLFIFSFSVMGVFILVSILEYYYHFGFIFSDNLTEVVIQTIILFSNLFPVTLFLALEVFEMLNCAIVNKKSSGVLVNNPKSIEKLGLCEYLITESTGVFTDSTISIESCVYLNSIYQANIEQYLYESNLGSSNEAESDDFQASAKPKVEKNIKSFENLKQVIKNPSLDEEKLLFGIALAICNNYLSSNSTLCEDPLDTALVQFAYDLGFKISAKENKKFIIEFNLKQFTYKVLLTAAYKDIGKIFLLKNEESENVYLIGKIVKETELALMLEEPEMEIFYESKSRFYEKKYSKVFYLYKSLDPESVSELLQDYKRAKSYKNNKLKMVYSALAPYSTSMKLLTELAYLPTLNPGSAECIQSLKKSGLKVWISSSSSGETTKALGYQLTLVPETSKIIDLTNFKSPHEALKKVENILSSNLIPDQNRNYIDNRTNFYNETELNGKRNRISNPFYLDLGYESEKLIKIEKLKKIDSKLFYCIDSNTLRQGFSCSELMQRLLYIMFAAESVIFCDMTPDCKKMLVKLTKESFHFRPKILAVGTSDSAFKMVAEADVGLMISPNFETNYYADVVIREFAELENLILNKGRSTYLSLNQIIHLTVFKEFSTILVIFLYQIDCSFSGTPIIDFDLIVIFELILSFIFILSVSLQGNQVSLNLNYPSFMNHSNIHKSIFYQILVGSLNGILIYYFVINSFRAISNPWGFTQDFGSIGITLFILLNFSLYIQAALETSNIKRTFFMILLNMTLLIITLASSINKGLEDYAISTESYTRNLTTWYILCILPLILFVLNFSSRYLFRKLPLFLNKTRYSEYKNNMKKLIINSSNWKKVTSKVLELDKKNLKFKDSNLENEFQAYINKNIKKHITAYLIMMTIFQVIDNILTEVGAQNSEYGNRYYFVITGFCILLTILSFFLKDKQVFYFKIAFYSFVLVASVNKSINDRIITSLPRYPIFTLIFCLDLNHRFRYSIVKGILLYVISIFSAVYETYVFDKKDLPIHTTHWIIIMLINLILILVQCYAHEFHQRKEFLDIQSISIEVEKSSVILSYLLPSFVRNRVKNGVRYIAEDKGIVSIVFCDIYDFDKILTIYTTQELTSLLNNVFERIDMLCDTCGVTKIETVGKTYLACTGLKDSEKEMNKDLNKMNHARRAVDLALAIISNSKSLILKDGSKIKFKIGVNSGPVTAGVVGYHKPQFSLVGDTVNTASRMASTLKESDSVQISEETFQLLHNKSGLEFLSNQIEAKGKGIMSTKLVFLKKSDDLTEDCPGTRKGSFTMPESPRLLDSIERISDPSTKFEPKNYRQSLLVNLELANKTELFKTQTMKKVKHNLKFSCKETNLEKKFRIEYLNEISLIQYIGIIASVTCNFLLIIAESVILSLKLNHYSFGRLMIIVFGEIFMIVILFFWKKYSKNLWFSCLLSAKYTLEILAIFIVGLYSNINKEMAFMYFSYNFLLLNFYSGNLFCKNLIFNSICITVLLVQTILIDVSFQYIAYAVYLVLIVLYIVYAEENKMRFNAVLKNLAGKELKKTEELLSQMMPPQALSELEMGIQVNNRVKLVTIMYADIVGFTAWSSIRTPNEVVGMLSELFTRFDKMCVEHSVYKVHTIGDCYVAMGYISENNRNPAKEAVNMINFALSLIEVIEETNQKCGINLGMRIGLHTGEIIGGITGTKVIRYDIYGSDVQIANKMESSGESGRVCVSEVTKSLVEDYMPDIFSFEFKKKIEFSSLDLTLSTYFADRLRFLDN